ncbi:thiamine-phosphate kinase [Rathayibacter sp. KR2-224]|uniref:thiamine-phosphate kinase n=1 Tax=Rathayibacter sp. KR2-224 TaxID=3400913 RepID=UPI003C03FB60
MVDSGRATDAATLASEGELATLRRIFPRLPQSSVAIIGPGDDAAVLAAPDGRYVVTTDMMIAGPDFRWAWSSPADIGWKAAATNLADVAAMGAVPTALVVAIAAPPGTPVTVLEQVADGLRQGCEALAPGCGVVGGDLSVSDVFTVAVTAFGDLQGREPVLRSGARPGDVVAVAGTLGLAAKGLNALFAKAVDADGVPDAARAADVAVRVPEVAVQRRPNPPIAAGVAAALAGATAMLDVSDGLALDAGRVAEASGVVIDVHSRDLGSEPEWALAGGEDHALLACFPPEALLPEHFRAIGAVLPASPDREEEGSRVSVDGQPYQRGSGWDPYSGWDGASG